MTWLSFFLFATIIIYLSKINNFIIAGSVNNKLPGTIVFTRVSEKNENAFTLLIPKDWHTEGGIVRIDFTVANDMQKRMRSALPMIDFNYDAAVITVTYQENGVQFTEKIVAVVEDWGQMGAGMWANKETFFVRTPLNEYNQWEAVFQIIRNSIRINHQWLAGEIRGQLQRSKIVIDTQQEIQRIDREITAHRQITNTEINNDMFLTLTSQEEYVNPYTKEVEIGSNQWDQRWINEGGDVIYTNDESYDLRTDVNLNRTDFKRTPVRKR